MNGRLLPIFLWCLSAGLQNAGTSQGGAEGPRLTDMLHGEWAAEKWAVSLKKGKSPFKAEAGKSAITHLLITEKGGELSVNEILDCFHEGTCARRAQVLIKSDKVAGFVFLLYFDRPKYEGKDAEAPKKTGPDPCATIKFIGKNRIMYRPMGLDAKKPSAEIYVKCEPNIRSYVNRHTIAGKFRDGQNDEYIFNEDGSGSWSDSAFSYEVDIDDTFAGDVDVVRIKKSGNLSRAFGFGWDKGSLRLYELVPSGECGDILNGGRVIKELYPAKESGK